jgi:hypothetical protein
MHVSDVKHEFQISPHILPQVFICGIHKVTELAPQDVVEIPWNKFRLEMFFKELSSVAMVLPLLLPHGSPPCGGITLQVGLGKLHGRMPSHFGGMYIILHLGKPSIHNLSVTDTIKIPRLGRLKPFTFGGPRFEGRHQLTKVGPIHFEEDFKLLRGE